MRPVVLVLLALVALGALLLVRSGPPEARLPEPASLEPGPEAPGAPDASAGPRGPVSEGAGGGADAPGAALAPPAVRPDAPAAPAPAAAGTEEPAQPPLEDLLRVPGPDPRAPLGLETDRNPHLRAVPPEGTAGAPRPTLKDRVRVDHRSEQAGVPGPRETTVGRTDASVGVPVKDSVELRGGVRVDSRREGDGALEEVEPAPSVGVDVRF